MKRLLLLALVLAGCGGSAAPAPTTTAPPPPAADVFPAQGAERATVVLFHGWTDLDPTNYRPWIGHLNAQGMTVVFPRYQDSILSTPAQMLAGAERTTRAGLAEAPPSGPVIAVGYSLGGGYATVMAASAAAWDVPQAAAVYGVFPALPPVVPDPFGAVPAATTARYLVGDRDEVVGRGGADDLAAAIAPHPATITVLRSEGDADFGHLAGLSDAPWAQRAIWAPNRKSTRLNSSHVSESRMPSSA